MIAPLFPMDERARVETLRGLNILDTPPEERFDRITRLARRVYDVPVALITLVDSERQWFKSRQGIELCEISRDVSFCAHVILDDEVLVVPDARRDERFADNPLVRGTPEIRFYAGCPVRAPDGSRLGTLCIMDRRPRSLSVEDRAVLHDLATVVEGELAATSSSVTDPLTGLNNRRGFYLVAETLLALFHRLETEAVLLFFDLDRLHAINDELGHAAGDRALAAMGQGLRRAFRRSDVIARWGSDEFCALAMLTVPQGLARPLKALATATASVALAPGRNMALEYSVSMVEYEPGRPADLRGMISEAQRLMHEEKAQKHDPQALP
ncbi:MAG: sensor domain-containing diguanylate cyclase [Gammaproteobacteria bacterium]|nr:sensor domain-containing diguanylate cyclase [Gammaproteobacteria bacterium]NIR83248.1 sensor domain-containing diguanylate cyclase [Gammaproteobacteria bacterium]NIR91052.1 sensor domain-containing diguanylate cyclase [Gammaproteobacteria bacterium]NIU04413.1 sensor domain-containing diguanylate cyclase [Gammaproteobacteria bacterium]NIV76368.1 diguanylate cyclase [Gammaproteobacteria bacterium]